MSRRSDWSPTSTGSAAQPRREPPGATRSPVPQFPNDLGGLEVIRSKLETAFDCLEIVTLRKVPLPGLTPMSVRSQDLEIH
jgi:hypothetical protein